MNVLEKLLEVQKELKAPKSQNNTFGGYKYRNCEDILEAVKPLLAKVKATLIIGDELVVMGDRYYVKATASFVDIESAEEIDNTAYAREEEVKKGMDGSQITGASSSYARKYALNGLFAIDDTKDSDTTNKKEPATEEQISRIHELQVNEANVLRRYKIKTLEELSYNDAEFVIRSKEKALEKVVE